jgi:cytidine deaminase
MTMSKRYKELVAAAINAKEFAHAPYSKFRVGAAILTKDGRIITGCNIESSSYGLTICAERTAIFKAYSEGIKEFTAIAVVSDDPDFTPPCGACRQVLVDLAGDIDFVMANAKNKLKILRLKSLLPFAFTSRNLNRIRQSKEN